MSTGNRYYRTDCGRCAEGRVRNHLLDRLNTGYRLLGKRESERHRAEQLAIDIDGAAAHALHDAGFRERTTAQASEDDALLWREILQYSEDLDLKIFDAIVLEDSAANAMHPCLDILEPEEVL